LDKAALHWHQKGHVAAFVDIELEKVKVFESSSEFYRALLCLKHLRQQISQRLRNEVNTAILLEASDTVDLAIRNMERVQEGYKAIQDMAKSLDSDPFPIPILECIREKLRYFDVTLT
jgi:hypothetical protein